MLLRDEVHKRSATEHRPVHVVLPSPVPLCITENSMCRGPQGTLFPLCCHPWAIVLLSCASRHLGPGGSLYAMLPEYLRRGFGSLDRC